MLNWWIYIPYNGNACQAYLVYNLSNSYGIEDYFMHKYTDMAHNVSKIY